MTGFRISWFFIRGDNTNQTDVSSNAPKYRDDFLVHMVQVASWARSRNITTEDIMKQALQAKILGYYRGCSETDKVDFVGGHYDGLEKEFIVGKHEQVITDEDVNVGFKIFSALRYCETEVKREQLFLFLHNLVTAESPRTLIRATVNTIQEQHNINIDNRDCLNKFYLSLDSIFHFRLGKILLATLSLEELKSMIANDSPFFSNYTAEVEQCLSGAGCQSVRDLIQTIGKAK
jgi:hypothetical protein